MAHTAYLILYIRIKGEAVKGTEYSTLKVVQKTVQRYIFTPYVCSSASEPSEVQSLSLIPLLQDTAWGAPSEG